MQKKNAAISIPLVLLSMGAAGCSSNAVSESATTSEATSAPVTVEAMEQYSSTTLDDWQAYADAIVVADVNQEARIDLPESETNTGEGTDLIGREITVEISKAIWADTAGKFRDFDTVRMAASGWLEGDGKLTEVVVGDGARLEVGHQYVLALKWFPERSDEGDETEPAQWGIIGANAALPADADTIGVGEYRGSEIGKLSTSEVPEGSVLGEHLGQSIDEFAASLADFKRVEREPVIEDPEG